MSDLLVLVFDSETGAMQLEDKLLAWQKQGVVQFTDAAVVVHRQDGKAKVKRLPGLVETEASGGPVSGMLTSLIFLMPWLVLPIDTAKGVKAGKFDDIGLDDGFVKEVGRAIELGFSALFLLAVILTEDQLAAELSGMKAQVLQTSLSGDGEARLRQFFNDDAPGA